MKGAMRRALLWVDPDKIKPMQALNSIDTSTQCDWCGGRKIPEHAHYKCVECGQRDSCCSPPY